MNNYLKGILWGCGNYSENRMIVRHSKKYFVEKIQENVKVMYTPPMNEE